MNETRISPKPMLPLYVQRTLAIYYALLMRKYLLDSSRELMKTGPKERPLSSFGGNRTMLSSKHASASASTIPRRQPEKSLPEKLQASNIEEKAASLPAEQPSLPVSQPSQTAEQPSNNLISSKQASSSPGESFPAQFITRFSSPLSEPPFPSNAPGSAGFVSAKAFIRGSFRYRHTRWRRRRPRRMNHRRIWRYYLRMVRERFFYRQLGRISRRDRENLGRLRGRYTFHHQQKLREEIGQRGRAAGFFGKKKNDFLTR
ncbi:MAG: hypothetical protein M1530_03105 [Candidatus Marsarchaeota archaeon]|nr:hypothetical protein [Candidatus Marsarchaeota archaeon]